MSSNHTWWNTKTIHEAKLTRIGSLILLCCKGGRNSHSLHILKLQYDEHVRQTTSTKVVYLSRKLVNCCSDTDMSIHNQNYIMFYLALINQLFWSLLPFKASIDHQQNINITFNMTLMPWARITLRNSSGEHFLKCICLVIYTCFYSSYQQT